MSDSPLAAPTADEMDGASSPAPIGVPSASSSPSDPTFSPTHSLAPSVAATTAAPSPVPTGKPTLSPVVPPTASPSREETLVSARGFATQLLVNEARKMNDIEQEIFRGIMQSHTMKIGLNISKPFIQTECTIFQQELGRPTPNTTLIVLQVTYLMNWTSRYGIDEIANYPAYFLNYMGTQGGDTLDSFKEILFITEANAYIEGVGLTAYVNLTNVVIEPTPAPTAVAPKETTISLAAANTTQPTAMETMWPSEAPSAMIAPATPVISPGTEQKREGVMIGILVAFGVVLVAVLTVAVHRWHLMKERRRRERADATRIGENTQEATEPSIGKVASIDAAQDQYPAAVPITRPGKADGYDMSAAVAIPYGQSDAEAGTTSTPETARMTQQTSNKSSATDDPQISAENAEMFSSTMATKGALYPTIDSMITVGNDNSADISRERSGEVSTPSHGHMLGANLMVARSESFSTDSLDGTLSSNVSLGGGDEFDRYKNQVLEKLRTEVEESVDGVEGMLSLAITRILMDADVALDMAWIGGEDLGSIEASCLYHAFEWERKRDSLTEGHLTGQSFFEDMVNKVVAIVHHGLIRPNDGARILHCCASIVELPLLKQLPNTTLVIQGLIKTNELAQGHHMLVATFTPYGDIVDASIAPQNRGFGFVRFVQPKSVDDVLQTHEAKEIEIQDVAVSIRTLGGVK